MMRTRLIVEGGLTAEAGGFAVTIRLPWYRALPISVIDLPAVTFDGEAIDPSSVTLEVDGRRYDAASIQDATDHWWYCLDSGTLHVAGPAIEPGSRHDVSVSVPFAPPYIPEITLLCAATKSLVASAGAER